MSARIAVLGIFITGCASVTGSGSRQTIKVDTVDARGASLRDAACVLSNDKGTWKVSTPEAAEVTRSNNALTVKCSKQGHPDGNALVNSSTRDEMYGNLIVGGLVGIAIDHSTGAGYEYPTYVAVRMGELVTASLAKPTGRRAQHERDLPPASGYADVANVDAVPYLSDRGRELYRQYLARPAPKAFALSAQGAVSFWANSPRAVGKAIENCDKHGRGQCTLYAYDDTVVWVKPADMPLASAGTKKPAAVTLSPPKQHAWAIPAASGFAKLTDAGSIPFVRDTGRAGYGEFLKGAAPRAFAIANSGHWSWRSNNENAIAQALEHCRELSKRECWLYAVDESVVWIPDPELRAGLAMPRPAE